MKKRTAILTIVLTICLLLCGCTDGKNKITVVKDFEITEEMAQANHVRYNTELITSSKYYNGGFVEKINNTDASFVVVTKISSESYYWEEEPSNLYTENIGAYTKSTVRIDKIITGDGQMFFGEELYVGRELVILEGYGISPENTVVTTSVAYVTNEAPFPIMRIGEQYVLELWQSREVALNDQITREGLCAIYTLLYEYLDENYKFHSSEPITGRTNHYTRCGEVRFSAKEYKGTLLPHNIWEFSESSYQRAISALEREPNPEITDEYFFEVKTLWETYGKGGAE